jgi:hypothetical protein
LVFDADDRFKFVKRIPTWKTNRGERPEPIKGSRQADNLMSVPRTGDLTTDKTVWQRGDDADCCDRMAISTGGRTI